MRPIHRPILVLCGLVSVGLACRGLASPAPAQSATSTATSWPERNEAGVRYCRYDPAVPPAGPLRSSPRGTPTLVPTPTLPAASPVDSDSTARQLETFHGVWNAVNENYVDPGFNGHDWSAIGERYEAIVRAGLSDEAFYALLQAMIAELGDEHSYYQSRAAVAEEESALAGRLDFVGIGILAKNTGDGGAVLILVFPDGPAAEAGLMPHDTIVSVDGGPPRDERGISRTLGPEGTMVDLTVRTPGEAPREVTVTRRRVTGPLPVDSCLVPGTGLGYVMLPTFLDETIDDQLRQALTAMTFESPMEGLILDNRMNGGGLESVARATLGMFLEGPQGAYVTRTTREELVIVAEDIGGSQAVPLVVLVSPETVSYGEIVSGILQRAGRATVVGQTTLGNVEQLRRYDLPDGSRAWIASATFEPRGLAAGIWEDTGIVPEVLVSGTWDEFQERNDPGLAAAVEVLLGR